MTAPVSVGGTQSVNLQEKQLLTALVNDNANLRASIATLMAALVAATTVANINTAATAFTAGLPAATITT